MLQPFMAKVFCKAYYTDGDPFQRLGSDEPLVVDRLPAYFQIFRTQSVPADLPVRKVSAVFISLMPHRSARNRESRKG